MPPQKCEANLHDKGKSKMAAIVNKVYCDQIKYSFVLRLISLSSLATTNNFQNDSCFKMKAVGVLNINTKECKSGRHLSKWFIDDSHFT